MAHSYFLDNYGKGKLLRQAEIPDPEPGDRDVLIAVHAAALNPVDSKIRDGALKQVLHYDLPVSLGYDLAGVVVAVGKNVHQFQLGDEVYARVPEHQVGTLTTIAAVDQSAVAKKPANLTMQDAAGLPLTVLTAWQALVDIAGLQSGQKVFIQAGSGGVGAMAIQIAKYIGATVATTVGARNTELVKSLGADVVIDYRSKEFADVLADYDVVLHSQGTDDLVKSLKILKSGGRLVSISGPVDPAFAQARKLNIVQRMAVQLLSLRARLLAHKFGVSYRFMFMNPDGPQLGKIAQLVENGQIRPVTDRVFRFNQVNEAFAYLDSGRATGKVVVDILAD